MFHLLTHRQQDIHFSDPVPTDPVPVPDPIPRPQPMPDPPPDEVPIKLSHHSRRSARIRTCRL
ncbi:proline-rich small protein YnaL [Citrobacter amalonaticus]